MSCLLLCVHTRTQCLKAGSGGEVKSNKKLCPLNPCGQDIAGKPSLKEKNKERPGLSHLQAKSFLMYPDIPQIQVINIRIGLILNVNMLYKLFNEVRNTIHKHNLIFISITHL